MGALGNLARVAALWKGQNGPPSPVTSPRNSVILLVSVLTIEIGLSLWLDSSVIY